MLTGEWGGGTYLMLGIKCEVSPELFTGSTISPALNVILKRVDKNKYTHSYMSIEYDKHKHWGFLALPQSLKVSI